MAEHYPFETSIHKRTGTVIFVIPIYIPKELQIQQGHFYKKYKMIAFKDALWKTFIRNIVKEAYYAFRIRIWFVLAYLGLI
ncbi:MAG TPA: hypothetical protein VH500_00900 [Nitrososphaeraceae archaeon]